MAKISHPKCILGDFARWVNPNVMGKFRKYFEDLKKCGKEK
jgi:hypothetical protein